MLTPTEAGWHYARVAAHASQPERWACIDVVAFGGHLYALRFGVRRPLAFALEWGGPVPMPTTTSDSQE